MKKFWLPIIVFLFFNETYAQKWVVKDSILVFPSNFNSWLKRNNGGIDLSEPQHIGGHRDGKVGTNQGIDVFDFNKDGLMDLTLELHPHNSITREYLKGIFIQNKEGRYVLDTNYVIKGKGDMWRGSYADFNGDGLMDYHYLTHNYHGADSNRKYSPEMVIEDWPDRVFINNGKSFDTLSLDPGNYRIQSTYTADIDGDGADEIIAAYSDRYTISTNTWRLSRITIYKYDKSLKKFNEIGNDLTNLWNAEIDPRISSYPVFSIVGVNNKNEFYATLLDSAAGPNIWDYKKFTLAHYNFQNKKLTKYSLNRDSVFIPEKFSKAGVDRPNEGGDDYFKFMIHNINYADILDLDMNGEKEIIVGGFYQNNHKVSVPKYAYGWRVLGLNGKDLTNQFFPQTGIDRGTDLVSHMLDIDEFNPGPEWIPGVWGLDPKYYIDGSPTLGYYYKYVNGKMQKALIRDIVHESGSKLDSNYFFEMQIVKFPEFSKNKNALFLYDFWDIKRSAIVYQINCSGIKKPVFDKSIFSFCSNDSISLKITNVNQGDSFKWYFGNKVDASNITTKYFSDPVSVYVIRKDSTGCTISSDTIQLIKNTSPQKPEAVSLISYCQNAIANPITANVNSGNSLLWYGTSASGGTSSTSANVPSTTIAGLTDYYVSQKVNSTGCESPRAKITVKVNPTPAKPNYNTNKFTFCSGDSLKLSVTNVNKGDTLKWYFGTRTDFTNVSNKTFTDSTKVFVIRTDSLGCSNSSDTASISILERPSKPTISWNGNEFSTASTYSSYQWLYNDSVILGANSSQHKPANPGNYKVRVGNTNQCTEVSSAFNLLVTSLSNPIFDGKEVKIYPNPALSKCTIDLAQQPQKIVSFRLFTNAGAEVGSWSTKQRITEIDLDYLPKGNYIIEIRQAANKTFGTIIKN